MDFIYDIFPRIYWTKNNPMQSLEDRIQKLGEEANEVANVKNDDELLDETLDVIHCCVEILRGYNDELVTEALVMHNVKNDERGYYKPMEDE